MLCALAVGLKYKLGFDDSLDVVGVHLVGGLVGTLLVGLLLATADGAAQRWRPACSTVVGGTSWAPGRRRVLGHGVTPRIGAAISALIVKYTIGLRITQEDEVERHR